MVFYFVNILPVNIFSGYTKISIISGGCNLVQDIDVVLVLARGEIPVDMETLTGIGINHVVWI